MPICALAAATARSAEAMSGRRCSSVEGTPVGTCGTARRPPGNGQIEVGRRRTHAHRDRVLQRGARACQRGAVGARVDQLGLRLQHVALRRDAGGVAVARDLVGALVALDRLVEQADFGVGLAQRKVVAGEQADRRQARRRQVGGTGLRAGLRARHGLPQPAPDVGRPARAQIDREGVADAAAGRALRVAAGGSGTGRDRGKERGPTLPHQRLGLRIIGDRRGDVLVGQLHAFGQRVERGIAEQLPPCPAVQRIGRRGGDPASCGRRFLPCGGRRRRGNLVARTHRTGAQQQCGAGAGQREPPACKPERPVAAAGHAPPAIKFVASHASAPAARLKCCSLAAGRRSLSIST